MTTAQTLIVAVLVGAVAMFLWGRWRHDMVAVAALLVCVVLGLVAPEAAFTGFGHPAVITVAAVLVLSRGLQTSGAVDILTRRLIPAGAGPTLSIAALTVIAALLSGFMNNVGALALLLPIAIQRARKLDLPPGRVLMPLAFGSILGGMTTLIGTPPNLVVSGFREANGTIGFGLFDFTPVGAVVAAAGVTFVVLGWRLVPARKPSGIEGFETSAYLTEARVEEDSKAAGLTLREIEERLKEFGAQVVGLVRADVRLIAPHPTRVVLAGDVLVLEAEADALSSALSALGLELEEAVDPNGKRAEEEAAAETQGGGEEGGGEEGTGDENGTDEAAPGRDRADGNNETDDADSDDDAPAKPAAATPEVVLSELAVVPRSSAVGLSASDLSLRTRYGINLLAVSREGRRAVSRLRSMPLHAGDVLLMQGSQEAIREFASHTGSLPLAARDVRIPNQGKALAAAVIMVLSVAVAAFGLLPAAVAFTGGVLASMAFRTVAPRAVYDAIDWPVIVLLAALLPVADAMQTTGAASLIAGVLTRSIAQGNPVIALTVMLVTTMVLTDVMNNAATAAVMAPIAIGVAGQVGANSDAFLMAVAIGASCSFLTPIGHQNNTLIWGPGGFRFGDYWRVGLPLEIIVAVVAIPMLLVVWPL